MVEVWYAENSLQMPAAVKVLQKRFCSDPELVSVSKMNKLMVQLHHPNIRKNPWFFGSGRKVSAWWWNISTQRFSEKAETGERFSNDQLIKWWNDLRMYCNTPIRKIIHRDIKPSNLFLTDDGQIVLDLASLKSRITPPRPGHVYGYADVHEPWAGVWYENPFLQKNRYLLHWWWVFIIWVTGAAPYDNQMSDFEVQGKILLERIWILPCFLNPGNPCCLIIFLKLEERKELEKIEYHWF